MAALISWLVSQFGQLGGALVAIVLVFVGAAIARYAFWSLAALLVLRRVRRDHHDHLEDDR